MSDVEIMEGETSQAAYKVSLPLFEGPLDLLLHLIKKEDVDIYDIPISKMLEQYLEYIELAQELNIDLAGEFIEMAAELALMKSRTLLPETQEEAEEIADPREELVQRLLEYQKFKLAAQSLYQRPWLERDVFRRGLVELKDLETEEPTLQVDLASLLGAFQEVLKRLPSDKAHQVRDKGPDMAQRILDLTDLLRGKDRLSFDELFEGQVTRLGVVVTFLSILQMAKQGFLKIIQEQSDAKRIFIQSRIQEGDPVLDVEDLRKVENEEYV